MPVVCVPSNSLLVACCKRRAHASHNVGIVARNQHGTLALTTYRPSLALAALLHGGCLRQGLWCHTTNTTNPIKKVKPTKNMQK